jgi:hypothetical protein
VSRLQHADHVLPGWGAHGGSGYCRHMGQPEHVAARLPPLRPHAANGAPIPAFGVLPVFRSPGPPQGRAMCLDCNTPTKPYRSPLFGPRNA